MPESAPISFAVTSDDTGKRLDQFLVQHMQEVSRARVQQWIEQGEVRVNQAVAKASSRLRGGEVVTVMAQPQAPPLRAMAEDIPLDLVYEDNDLAVVNKPAGMMVHAGAGATDDDRNRGTLVNALLHHFAALSSIGGELRPGIVHRLDKQTSGLMIVAKNDAAHRKLSALFSSRKVKKTYVALVHGRVKQEQGTIQQSIGRDLVRRTRMTTRRSGGREAITHYRVVRRVESRFGKFTLVEVKIDTGRTHQIRVHMSALGHPVAGDKLYGAPETIRASQGEIVSLERNFLHAAALEFEHPGTHERLSFSTPLPPELQKFLEKIEAPSAVQPS